jgi:hypothetical protein
MNCSIRYGTIASKVDSGVLRRMSDPASAPAMLGRRRAMTRWRWVSASARYPTVPPR